MAKDQMEQVPEEVEEYRRKKRGKKGGGNSSTSVNINSLMDIMTIILVFLLKSYGEEPIVVVGEDLQVPGSETQLTPEDMTSITITQKAVIVDKKEAAQIRDGQVDPSQKTGGATGLIITPVLEELKTATEAKKREFKQINKKYEPVVTIVADQTTPYRLLAEVMYTAGQASLSKYKFAVVKERRTRLGQVQ